MTDAESLSPLCTARVRGGGREGAQWIQYGRATDGFVAHAMNNYLTITDATVSLLTHELRSYPKRDVGIWLEGLRHTAALMHHTVGRLLRASTPSSFPLKPDHVNVSVLMERACEYYQRIADRKQLKITCAAVGDVPPAWADRSRLWLPDHR